MLKNYFSVLKPENIVLCHHFLMFIFNNFMSMNCYLKKIYIGKNYPSHSSLKSSKCVTDLDK